MILQRTYKKNKKKRRFNSSKVISKVKLNKAYIGISPQGNQVFLKNNDLNNNISIKMIFKVRNNNIKNLDWNYLKNILLVKLHNKLNYKGISLVKLKAQQKSLKNYYIKYLKLKKIYHKLNS